MLVIIDGPDEGMAFKLGRRSLSIGREKGNLIQLVHKGISRRHVMIVWSEAGYRAVDLNSTNGTLVNGKAIKESSLQLGDVLKLGEVSFKLARDLKQVEDATFSRPKEVAPALVAVSTSLLNPAVGMLKYAPSAEPEPLPQPAVVDVEGLRQVDTSELEFSLFRINNDEDYQQVAFETIASQIAPDRAMIFLRTQQRKARRVGFWHQPTISPGLAMAKPAVKLLTRTMYAGRSQLDNEVPTSVGAETLVATAAAVCLRDHIGALYLDSLQPHKKIFLSTDIKLLQSIAEALSERIEQGG